MLKLVFAFVLFLVILGVGMFVLRALGRPVPEPPPPGELRRVNLRFRCSVCGAEVKMTSAPDTMPEPPRHCLDDMQLVASPYE